MRNHVPLVIILLAAALCTAAEAPGYKVTKAYPIPGDGIFDYILFDASSNRLYVSHDPVVQVLDAQTGKLLGTVENTPGIHGIAVVPALHRGFTSNEGDNTVSVFDTKTFNTMKKIPVEIGADAIVYDPLSKRVLVCHEDGHAITAIDPEKNEVVGVLKLRTKPEALIVRGAEGYAALSDLNMILNFDPLHLTEKQRWPIPGCVNPTPLNMDVANSRLFIGCRNSKVLAVMDTTNGKVITTLPIGEKVDGLVFDPDTKTIFASNADGTITVIREKSANEYESVGTIKTQQSAKTITFDPKTKRLFLSAADVASIVGTWGPKMKMVPKPGTFRVLVVERQRQAAVGK